MPDVNAQQVGDAINSLPTETSSTGMSSSLVKDINVNQGMSPLRNFKPTKLGIVKFPNQQNQSPTLDNYKTATSVYQAQNGNFAESNNHQDLVKIALDNASPVKSKLAALKDLDPAARAEIGAKFGGGLGLAIGNGDTHRAVVGAAIGAMGARGLGLAQSGEHEASIRREKVINTMKTLGAISKDGYINYSDGTQFSLNNDPTNRLQNLTTSILNGAKDRAHYEVDPTHPMSNRTIQVARPIARYLSQGLLNYNDMNNKHDLGNIEHTTGMLVNAFQSGAKSIDHVYSRAQETAQKLKISEPQIRGFFDRIKTSISDKEAESIKKGLSILYPPIQGGKLSG